MAVEQTRLLAMNKSELCKKKNKTKKHSHKKQRKHEKWFPYIHLYVAAYQKCNFSFHIWPPTCEQQDKILKPHTTYYLFSFFPRDNTFFRAVSECPAEWTAFFSLSLSFLVDSKTAREPNQAVYKNEMTFFSIAIAFQYWNVVQPAVVNVSAIFFLQKTEIVFPINTQQPLSK